MSELMHRLEQEAERLKTKRDELRVQLDLGRKDLEDAWHQADEKWSKLESYLLRLKREGGDTLDEIGDAAEILVEEIKDGFKKLRELI